MLQCNTILGAEGTAMVSIQFENDLDDLKNFYAYYLRETVEGQKRRKWLHLRGQIVYLVVVLIVWGFSNSIWPALWLLILLEIGLFLRAGFHPGLWIAQRTVENELKRFSANELENMSLPKKLEFSRDLLTIRSAAEAHFLVGDESRK